MHSSEPVAKAEQSAIAIQYHLLSRWTKTVNEANVLHSIPTVSSMGSVRSLNLPAMRWSQPSSFQCIPCPVHHCHEQGDIEMNASETICECGKVEYSKEERS